MHEVYLFLCPSFVRLTRVLHGHYDDTSDVDSDSELGSW